MIYNKNKVPNMKYDLINGCLGENKVLKYLSKDFQRTGTKANDIINNKTGVKIEVKFESYSHERVAIEQYSNAKIKSIGGVHKASRDGCKYIIHFFNKTNTVAIFKVKELLDFIGEPDLMDSKFNNLFNCKMFNKINKFNAEGKEVEPWITKGFAVPLSFFPKELYKLIHLSPETNLDSFLN